MHVPESSSVFITVITVVVVAALATTLSLLPSQPGTTTSTGQKSASVTSADGLKLTLQISGARIGAGGSVTINVTETNTRAIPLNISAARDWSLRGLRMSACYSSVYPFGVAVYQGHYTGKNVSSAVTLNLYPFVPCPLLLRYVSGYYFHSSSNSAVVLPGTGSAVSMAAGLVAAGNYTSGNNRNEFAPGQYTVAAGDEWGAVVFLYFDVN